MRGGDLRVGGRGPVGVWVAVFLVWRGVNVALADSQLIVMVQENKPYLSE